MKNTEHRLGVSEVNLVVRHLKLDTKSVGGIQDALSEIDKLYGLDTVSRLVTTGGRILKKDIINSWIKT